MSLRSPRHKYSCSITFDKYVEGIGQSVTVTGQSVGEVESIATQYKNYHPHVCISENVSEYPVFNWVKVKDYYIK